MKKSVALLVTLTLVLALTLSGCGDRTEPSPSASSASPTSVEPDESGTPADATKLTFEDYFPFKENIHMAYAGSGNEYAAFDSWVDYIKDGALQVRKNNGGTELAVVYVIEDDAVRIVFSQEEAYYRQDFTAMRETDEILLMEPLEVGTSWQIPSGAQRSITELAVPVTVPYGTFTALEVTTVYDGSTTKFYYAPDIGLIKSEFVSDESPSEPITSELENYEEGSPLRQYAHFYYPDFENDRVAYIEKEIELMTNDDITGVFEKAFKTPEGSGLTPLMPEDATLSSISFDPGTGVVTADVSGQFITGMNAGAELEGLILQSVADTLGWYFQTEKVQLTVDGGPYESGHYLFNTGDYLPYDLDGAVEYTP